MDLLYCFLCESTTYLRQWYDFAIVGSSHEEAGEEVIVFEAVAFVGAHDDEIELYFGDVWVSGGLETSFDFFPYSSGLVGVVFISL